MYKASYLEGLSRLGSKGELVAASVYYACIVERSPRSLGEVSTISGQSSKKVGKMFQCMTRSAKKSSSENGQIDSADTQGGIDVLSDDLCGGREVTRSRVLPEDVVSRPASFLRLPGPLICVARDTCAKITKLQLLEGTSPQAVAAAVIVILVLADRSYIDKLEKISVVSFSSIASIKKAYSLLRPHCILILPHEFATKVGGIDHIPMEMPDV